MQVFLKSWNIETGHIGVGIKIVGLQVVLIFEKQIVHGPKSALIPCCLRRLRRLLCEWMFVDQWEMPKYEPKLMFKSPTQVLYENKGLATVGTFEIAIGNDCHGRGVRPHDMVVRLQRFHVIGGSLSAHVRRFALSY